MKLSRQLILALSVALVAIIASAVAAKAKNERMTPAQWFSKIREKRYAGDHDEELSEEDSRERRRYLSDDSFEAFSDDQSVAEEEDSLEKRDWWNFDWINKRIPPGARGARLAKRMPPGARGRLMAKRMPPGARGRQVAKRIPPGARGKLINVSKRFVDAAGILNAYYGAGDYNGGDNSLHGLHEESIDEPVVKKRWVTNKTQLRTIKGKRSGFKQGYNTNKKIRQVEREKRSAWKQGIGKTTYKHRERERL